MKKFKFDVTLDNNGKIKLTGYNDGFNATEIIGFLEMKKMDILEQINHPDQFKHERRLMKDGEEFEVTEEHNPLAHPESYLDDTMAIVDDMTMAQRVELLKYLENAIEKNKVPRASNSCEAICMED